ncbi:hypothetical protein JYU34_017038 [Plutella xylostella]|uniref:Uncharacterized protein n=1 Tax=Plutella xylostella TaxID=51655 RepID=A0ABQ7Q490_PLUXY|nr:hypothetical protein JYU34_017038 [Plutella xylostella]
MHGIIYLYKSGRWADRAAWLAVLGASACLTVYLSFMIWQQYVIDPTVTVVCVYNPCKVIKMATLF